MMQSSSADRELLPLSWVSQWGYCPRRCGLLAIERLWQDNEYTAAGSISHTRAHETRMERRSGMILLYNLGVYSHDLGISGLCDCVEARETPGGAPLPFGTGRYALYPVEYKHGEVRDEPEYQMQLCAQAMCLEAQYGCTIERGALFFASDHRRDEIRLTDDLRRRTREAIDAVSRMVESGQIPRAVYGAKCRKCSMRDLCQPKMKPTSAAYNRQLLRHLTDEDVNG